MAETTELFLEPFPFHTRQNHMHMAHMVFGEGLYGWGIGNSTRPIWFTMLADIRCLQASMCGFTTPPFHGSITLSFFPGNEPGARSMPVRFNWDSFPLLPPLPLQPVGMNHTRTKNSRGAGSVRPDRAPWNPNRELSAQKTPLAQRQQVKGRGKTSYLLLSTMFPS